MAVVDSLRRRFVIGAVVRLVRLAVLFRFIAGKKTCRATQGLQDFRRACRAR